MRIDKEKYKKTVDESMEKLKDYTEYRRFVELAGTSHLSARNLAAVFSANRKAYLEMDICIKMEEFL